MTAGLVRLPTGGRIDRDRDAALHARRAEHSGPCRRHAGFGTAGQRRHARRPQLQVPPAARLPRGGVEEPNGLFTLGAAATRRRTLPARSTISTDGLTARRQNGWPSVDFDLRSAYGLLARRSWAPGSTTRPSWARGVARGCSTNRSFAAPPGWAAPCTSAIPTATRCATRIPDVLVVGAGPAGLAAALAAAASGARVVLAEQDSLAGGCLLVSAVGSAPDRWREQMLRASPRTRMPSCCCARRPAGSTRATPRSRSSRRDHACSPMRLTGRASRDRHRTLRARAIVFATGAIERPLCSSNNDRPGIMLASAVRSYLNRLAVLPGAQGASSPPTTTAPGTHGARSCRRRRARDAGR